MSLHRPENMFELIDWSLRKLGGDNIFQPPVGGMIEIDITPIQCIDRVTEALKEFRQIHMFGYKEMVIRVDTKQGQTEYVLPPEVLGVTYYLEIDDHTSMFSMDYQMKQSIGMRLSQFDIVTIQLAYQYLKQLNMQIGEKISFSFNQLSHTLTLNNMPEKDRVIGVVGHIAIDPEVTPDLWDDIWLRDYTFTLIKLQWGYNLKKFDNVTLPGGIQLSGKSIYEEAIQEKEKLEEDLLTKWSKPVKFFMG